MNRFKPMIYVPLISALALTGCAISPARMALPGSLAVEQGFAFEGIGAGQHGSFRAGPYIASFQRSDTRLALFDSIFERRAGNTSFALQGPEIDGTIEARCKVRERTITIRIVSFDPGPMAYSCDFLHQGRPIPSRFEVQEARSGLSAMLMRRSRRGEIAFDGVVLQIRSVHQLDGSALETATPVGYLFENAGIAAGAVELNGRPVVRFAPGTDLPTQRAVMVAATALGILWDPADSMLGREAE